MNKQEFIERMKSLKNLFGNKYEYIEIDAVIELASELDEPQKVTVPQFVADFIAEQKKLGHTLSYSIDACMSDRVGEWYWDNSELFALAWIDGYTVEKEPKYTVKFKATKQYLCNDDLGPHFDPSFRTNFTKSDLEKLGLGWVFECEGMEVEKVGK